MPSEVDSVKRIDDAAFDVDAVLQQMTLEEKASLCSGEDMWTFKGIERLGVPPIWVADGPHGLRKAPRSDTGGFGGEQLPGTCFPTASALAASWDTELLYEVGRHIGIECQAADVHVLLGPGVNIKRSPLCGRSFEYYSEDPVLSGDLAAAFINGVQGQGVGTSLKHFACNSQETRRMVASAEPDARALREIYLPAFERAVRRARPWTVMAAYNPLHGTDCSAHRGLLTDILRGEWGFEGVVVSDWFAVFDRVAGVRAGLNVEMPGCGGVNDARVAAAVRAGALPEAELDAAVRPTLRLIAAAAARQRPGATFCARQHHAFARKAAEGALVLLKNEGGALPLLPEAVQHVALIGEFAVRPRYQGCGSSEMRPTFEDGLKAELEKAVAGTATIEYARGYDLDATDDTSHIAAAAALAARADAAVLHVGLPHREEAEEYDRAHIDLPVSHVRLIEAVGAACARTVVVLTNGAAVAMPWLDRVPAVLETWLAGQAGAGAIAAALLGRVNPSGKLPETFPKRLEDHPAFLDFPGPDRCLRYSEGVFAGYRWFDKRRAEPLFPFGHGLSYTAFEYSGLELSAAEMGDDDTLTVSCLIRNAGATAGREVVQLYIADCESRLPRPEKELKGFAKTEELAPGEARAVRFAVTARDLSYFDDGEGQWVAESGRFEALVGASSRDIRLRGPFVFASRKTLPLRFDERTTLREWLRCPETRALAAEAVGPFFAAMGRPAADPLGGLDNNFLLDMPVIKYVYMSGGAVTEEAVRAAVAKARAVRRPL